MKILPFGICLFKLDFTKIPCQFPPLSKAVYIRPPSLSLWDILEIIDSKMALLSSHYHLALNSKSSCLLWEKMCFDTLLSFLFRNLPFLLATAQFPQFLSFFSFIFNSRETEPLRNISN